MKLHTDPRSRIFQNPESLEDWELIAILFGKGTRAKNVESLSRDVLSRFQGLVGLFNTEPARLLNEPGVGKAKIASLYAARELVNRLKLKQIHEKELSSETCRQQLIELLYLKTKKEVRECFYLMTMTHEKVLIRMELIARGSLTEVGVHIRDLVKIILDDAAPYCIISHNHPRQSVEPSFEDFELYYNMQRFLEKIEVSLLDQWIIGEDGVYSCEKRLKI